MLESWVIKWPKRASGLHTLPWRQQACWELVFQLERRGERSKALRMAVRCLQWAQVLWRNNEGRKRGQTACWLSFLLPGWRESLLKREPPWRLQQQDWGQDGCQQSRIAPVKGEPVSSQPCCDPESWQTEFWTQLSVGYMTIPPSIIQIILECLELPPKFRITIFLIPWVSQGLFFAERNLRDLGFLETSDFMCS